VSKGVHGGGGESWKDLALFPNERNNQSMILGRRGSWEGVGHNGRESRL